MTPELAGAIRATAERIGADPADLATAISYETAGTFDPWKAGPTTQWGQHRGLIQWGEPQRKQYGVTQDMPVDQQMQAVGQYLQDRGFKPGMGMMDLYSAINAGSVGRYNASDANNGGAPGTVADKVNNQMAGHRQNALRLLGMAQASAPVAAPAGSPQSQASPGPMPLMPGASASSESKDEASNPTISAIQQQLAALSSPAAQAGIQPMIRRAIQPFDRGAIASLLKRRA